MSTLLNQHEQYVLNAFLNTNRNTCTHCSELAEKQWGWQRTMRTERIGENKSSSVLKWKENGNWNRTDDWYDRLKDFWDCKFYSREQRTDIWIYVVKIIHIMLAILLKKKHNLLSYLYVYGLNSYRCIFKHPEKYKRHLSSLTRSYSFGFAFCGGFIDFFSELVVILFSFVKADIKSRRGIALSYTWSLDTDRCGISYAENAVRMTTRMETFALLQSCLLKTFWNKVEY